MLVTTGFDPRCHLTIPAPTGQASKPDLCSALGSNPTGAQMYCSVSYAKSESQTPAASGLNSSGDDGCTSTHSLEPLRTETLKMSGRQLRCLFPSSLSKFCVHWLFGGSCLQLCFRTVGCMTAYQWRHVPTGGKIAAHALVFGIISIHLH